MTKSALPAPPFPASKGAPMQFYNTMSRKKETFTPVRKGLVGVYACGITAYALSHIGHARSAVAFDILVRLLRYKGYEVTFVRNFTDVDDKIIKRANDEGVSSTEIAETYIKAYHEDMDRLGVIRADIEPRATEHIQEMLNLTERLIADGKAYATPSGDVYFRVRSFPGYGKLSGRTPDDLRSGARVVPGDEKEDPLDFALWKSAKPGEPYWESPWGNGRPGWHIECSAMSMKYLGESFDFHGGGSDLIFPHHENEIAQSEGCTGVHPFVRYWLHNGFITVNEEKMSKSLGNFFTVADILEHFEPETLRFFILSTHYRSPLDFSDERLKEAQRSLARLKTAQDNLKELAQLISSGPTETSKALYAKLEELRSGFMEAMSDDFNTALAISFMFELAKEINIYHQHISTGSEKPDGKLVENMEKLFAEFCGIIGVLETSAQPAAEKDALLEDKLIETVVSLRQEARAAKNYAQADALRNALTGLGIVLEDTPQGVRWKKQ